MFNVEHRVHFSAATNAVSIAKGVKTLQDAAALREVSGDLVVWAYSGKVVNSTSWLFGWEKKDPNCYARKAIAFSERIK